MPRILIIDDQPNRIEYFIEGLRADGFDVDVREEVDIALQYLETPPSDLVAILVDIIMPPGQFAANDHRAGTRTGIYLYARICEIKALQLISKHPIPLAVLTQSTDATTLSALNQMQIRYRPHEIGHHQVWSKVGLEVDDFVREFKEFLEAMKDIYGEDDL